MHASSWTSFHALDPLVPSQPANAPTHYLKLAHRSSEGNMPDLIIIDNLNESIHTAFVITAPTPGRTTFSLASTG